MAETSLVDGQIRRQTEEGQAYSTGKLASLIMRAVPPDARRRTLFLTRPLARSSSPVLS